MENRQILQKDSPGKEEIISLLKIRDRREFELLLSKADDVRSYYFDNKIHLRGIIDFSNCCEQNCLYCGLRTGNKALQRYRMDEDQILKTSELISSCGIKTIVLQSGEDYSYSGDFISKLIRQIKNTTGSAITLSLGERKFDEYEAWKDAGADRYLLKHETANPKLYSIYHQGQSLTERLEHLKFLKETGYQTGSGNLIGLPYQTIEDIADDILLCRQLDVDMASFSPFIPSPTTPYGNKKAPDLFTVLKVMAVARIILKDVYIPAATALAGIHRNGRKLGLLAGANVIMPDFTPAGFCEKYEIYPDKKADYNISAALSELKKVTESLNLMIAISRGDRIKSDSPLPSPNEKM